MIVNLDASRICLQLSVVPFKQVIRVEQPPTGSDASCMVTHVHHEIVITHLQDGVMHLVNMLLVFFCPPSTPCGGHFVSSKQLIACILHL